MIKGPDLTVRPQGRRRDFSMPEFVNQPSLPSEDALVTSVTAIALAHYLQTGDTDGGAPRSPARTGLRAPDGTPEWLQREFNGLLRRADQLQGLSIAHQFDDVTVRLLGEMTFSAQWAATNLSERLRPIASVHLAQLTKLEMLLKTVLPKIVQQLASRAPGASLARLLALALEFLLRQLGPILSVMQAYNTAFSQRRDLAFNHLLPGIDLYMSQAFNLPMTGDAGGGRPRIQPDTNLALGDVQLSAFYGNGLGVIPGNRGLHPVHLLLIPRDLQGWAPLILTLLNHEAFHLTFYSWKNMEEQMQSAVKAALLAAQTSGRLSLSQSTVDLKGVKLPLIEVLIKFFCDGIGEFAADGPGGVNTTGPHFLDAMMQSFPAMMIRGGKVSDAKALLRSTSQFALHDNSLSFEVHGPDTVRLALGTSLLKLNGFRQDADRINALAELACGGRRPDFTTWVGMTPDDPQLRIATADMDRACAIVAETLVSAKLDCLSGFSWGDLIRYTDKTARKVDAVTANIAAGKAELPQDVGTIYAPHIGAAAQASAHQQAGELDMEKLTRATFGMIGNLQRTGA